MRLSLLASLAFGLLVLPSANRLRSRYCGRSPSFSADAVAPGELFAKEEPGCLVHRAVRRQKIRNGQERAEMLKRLGITKLAYDWREEHVPTFEDEILQTQKYGIELTAFWLFADDFLNLARKHGIKPQFWVTMGEPKGVSGDEKIAKVAERLTPAVKKRNISAASSAYTTMAAGAVSPTTWWRSPSGSVTKASTTWGSCTICIMATSMWTTLPDAWLR